MQSSYFICILSSSFNEFRPVHSGNKQNIYIPFRVCLLQLKLSGYRGTVNAVTFLELYKPDIKTNLHFFYTIHYTLKLTLKLEIYQRRLMKYIYIYIYIFFSL